MTGDGQKKEKEKKKKDGGRKEETTVEDEGVTSWLATCVGNLLLQLGATPAASSSSSLFFFPLTNKKFMEWRGRWQRERWDYFGFGDLRVWFVLGVYCVWGNLWNEEEDDEERNGGLFWFWFGFVLISIVLVCAGLVI